MADPSLKAAFAAKKFIVAPGIFDGISARVADGMGFDCLYMTGFGTVASHLGVPDAGLGTYTDMVSRVATFARICKTPFIADGDTGYGGLLNVRATVQGYEAAGASGIQLEDQEMPKKCGHTPFKRLIPLEDMVEKIKVAVEARDDMLILARTDARQSEGMDGVMRRMEAYAEAGADVLFPEALTSEEEMRRACAELGKPVMANMANGGLTPMLRADVLADIGYAFAIYPSQTSLIAAAAVERALILLKEQGDAAPAELPMFDFKTFCEMIGFDEVWDFERRWGRDA